MTSPIRSMSTLLSRPNLAVPPARSQERELVLSGLIGHRLPDHFHAKAFTSWRPATPVVPKEVTGRHANSGCQPLTGGRHDAEAVVELRRAAAIRERDDLF